MKKLVSRLVRDEEGATAIEYGIIAGVIAVALILVLVNFRTQLAGMFNRAGRAVSTGQ